MKARRVDFYPDDWIAGTVDLNLAERGVYITACALIYSRGGPVELAHLRRACGGHGRPFNTALERLVAIGKLSEDGGMIGQSRCETEIRNAERRIEKWVKNFQNTDGNPDNSAPYPNRAHSQAGNPVKPRENVEKRAKLRRNFDETSSKLSRNSGGNTGKSDTYENRGPGNARVRYHQDQQSTDSKNLGNEGLGRCAPSERDASAGAGPPAATSNGSTNAERRDAGERDALTAEERAERIAVLGGLLTNLRSGTLRGNGISDPDAYERAVQERKRDAWLRELHAWASERFQGNARTEAWELIHAAVQAGSRDATPRPLRKRLDDLDKLFRADQEAAK